MVRRLITILSVVSMVLCAATCLVGVRSYWCQWRLSYEKHVGRWYTVSIVEGVALWEFRRCADPVERPPALLRWHSEYLPRGTTVNVDGFSYGPHFGRFGIGRWNTDDSPVDGEAEYWDCQGIQTPVWGIAVPLLAFPSMLYWKKSSRRRMREARCRQCGYDLRATPERCPECGAGTKVGPNTSETTSTRGT